MESKAADEQRTCRCAPVIVKFSFWSSYAFRGYFCTSFSSECARHIHSFCLPHPYFVANWTSSCKGFLNWRHSLRGSLYPLLRLHHENQNSSWEYRCITYIYLVGTAALPVIILVLLCFI
mmetsp:Transcript_25829/g.65309  ORF Transcript_25829/g.65309 Transcript_25829/m.65309 type:complete len:120 (+) Transcript_25829:880-1239(+)